MTKVPGEIATWTKQRELTLDMVGLTEAERLAGSRLLDTSDDSYVMPDDPVDYSKVEKLVFEWGDENTVDAFTAVLGDGDIPVPEHDAFVPLTVIGARLWKLRVEGREADLDATEETPFAFSSVDFSKATTAEFMEHMLLDDQPLLRTLGRVGVWRVAFEDVVTIKSAAAKIGTEASYLFPEFEIPVEKVLEIVDTLIQHWDFDNRTVEQTNRFTVNIVHWLAETFGQRDTHGKNSMYSNNGHKKRGFDGRDAPTAIKPLLEKEYMGETNWGDGNEVGLETSRVRIERTVPAAEPAITQSSTDVEPEGKPEAGERTVSGDFPQIRLKLYPESYWGWDLVYTINETEITVTPHGHGNSINKVIPYAHEANQNPKEIAKTACELALFGAKYAQPLLSGVVHVQHLKVLGDRLRGIREIPLDGVWLDDEE